MRKFVIIIIAILFSTIFTSCIKEAKQVVKTDNNHYKVELLFEVDGCKVYRFWDSQYPRYFTTCNGSVSHSLKHDKFGIQTVVKNSIDSLESCKIGK
jgi:hypothetical protein